MKFAVALLFAATTAAAQIVLGPERLVSEPRFQPVSAFRAAAAPNGSETFVVLQTGVSSSIYLQRVDAQGAPLTEHGIPVARGVWLLGGVASNGAGSVVFWSTDQEVWSTSIDSSGNVSAPQLVSRTSNRVTWPYLATNGTDYLAAWTDWNGSGQQVMAVRLDGRGIPLGLPFPLTERRYDAAVSALASDGHDYFAVIGTTLIAVGAGTKTDLPLALRALVYTTSGFIGFSDANGTTAIAIDPSGHAGAPAVITKEQISSAASNGLDAMALVNGGGTAIRVRRNGDVIETIDTTPLPALGSFPVAAVMSTGSYAAILLNPASVTLVNGAPVTRALLTWPAKQESPMIASDGDLKVVAWREGKSVRTARIRGGITLDPAGLDIAADTSAGPLVAINAGRTLIVWMESPEKPDFNSIGRVFGRLLNADGTLTAPFKIADGYQFVGLGSATAIASGFAVLWTTEFIDDFFGMGGWRVTTVDTNGNAGATTRYGPAFATNAAIVGRGGGYLTVVRSYNEYTDVATDGAHVLEVWMTESVTHEYQVWAQPLDAAGNRLGTAQLLGAASPAARPHATWNGSAFIIGSEASIAFVAANGSVLAPLAPLLPADSAQTVIAGYTIATRHSAIDTGLGDNWAIFVRTFSPTPPRHRAAQR